MALESVNGILSGWLAGASALVAFVAFMVVRRRHLAAGATAAAVIAGQSERLRTTLANIADAVITTDTSGCITDMNAVAESLTGCRNADAAGQPLETVFHIMHGQTGWPLPVPAMASLKDGMLVEVASDTVLIAANGTEHPIDGRAVALRNTSEEIVGSVLVFRDVTRTRDADARLRRSDEQFRRAMQEVAIPMRASEQRFRHAAEAVNGIIYEYDLQTGAVERTRGLYEVLGYHPDEVPQTAAWWIEQMHPDDRREVEPGTHGADERHDVMKQYRVRHKDGRWLTVEDRAVLLRDTEGRAVKQIGCTVDISDRKQHEHQLRRLATELADANRRKDEFLATLAHELRNPLAPIRNGLQMMKLAKDNPDTVEQARIVIERQLAQMVRLVDDLLDVSRISQGKLELRLERVALAAVLDHAVETSRPMIDSGGHQLDVRAPPDPIFVIADATRLEQVFANLLNNAAKYSHKGGRIWLTIEHQQGEAVVSVSDAGVGIPRDMLAAVFELFAQVDESREQSQGGLGIGLTLAKRLVEMHGGSVEATSDGLGKGSEFVVRLPVAEANVSDVPSADASRRARSSVGRRILVADDNEDSAASLAMILEFMGNEIRTAHDGVAAVDVAEAFRPHVVFLDIGMPALNGYDACRRIRERPWSQGTMLVALTGWGQAADRLRSEEAGFTHHLVKPIDPEVLEALLAARP